MITNFYDEVDVVYVPLNFYVSKNSGERSKFVVNIVAILNKDNSKILAIGKDLTIEKFNEAIEEAHSIKNSSKEFNPVKYLYHGDSPYGYCFGTDNDCTNNCSQIKVKASNNSDVIVTVKKGGEVIRNAFIERGRSFTFNLPNGTYQPFFYFGKNWDNSKFMKNSICGELYGGFTNDEHFGKDKEKYLYNNILTYELSLQNNGNFSTTPSHKFEAF